MIHCSGCGGNNPPGATVCEWCRRPFVLTHQRGLSARWWGVFSGAIVAILLVVLGLLLLLNANRGPRTSAAAAVPTSQSLPPFPVASAATTAASPVVAVPSPTLYMPPPIVLAPVVATPATAVTVRLVRVSNTGGQGVNLRREPATSAVAVATVAENANLRLIGPEQRAEGRLWRQVEDNRGNQGWVPADFLVEVGTGG